MADIRAVIKNTLKGLLPSKVNKDVIVGIDIGSAAVKVVQLKKERGKIVLDTYGEIATGPYAEKQVGESIAFEVEPMSQVLIDLMKEAQVTASYAGVSIQSAASLVFVLTVPSTNTKDVAGMVATEARKYIPVPDSEVSIDWWTIPQPEVVQNQAGAQATEVLVAAIRNEQLDEYRQVITASPVKQSFFEIEVFSAMRAALTNELTSLAIVDMGASSTRVSIVQYGVTKRFRTIKHGGYQMTEQIRRALGIEFAEAEQLKKQVGLLGTSENGHEQVTQLIQSELNLTFQEVGRVISEYEQQYNRAVSKMILLGGGARVHGLEQYVQQTFNGEVTLANPFLKIENPAFLDEALATTGPEFAIAAGLALKPFL